MAKHTTARILSGSLFFVLVATLCGCKKEEPPPGEPVSGKLTIKGKPPNTYATVEFVSVADPSQKLTGGVDPTGKFAGRAPQGRVKVAIKMGKIPNSGPVPTRGPGPGGPGGPPGGSGGPPPGYGPQGGPGGPGGPGGQDKGKLEAPPKAKGAVEVSANAQDPNKSGVEIDIPPGGIQDLELDFNK